MNQIALKVLSLQDRDSSTKNENQIKLATFNILSDHYVESCKYLYKKCNYEDVFETRSRYQRIIEMLRLIDADIYCLQEMEEAAFEQQFLPVMQQMGYTATPFVKKNSPSKSDGCVMFYRTSRISLQVCHQASIHSEQICQISKFRLISSNLSCQNLKSKSDHLASKNQPFLFSKLPPRHNFKASFDLQEMHLATFNESSTKTAQAMEFFVATTHLIYNPKAGFHKLQQICAFFAEISHFIQRNSRKSSTIRGANTPSLRHHHTTAPPNVIICGDFNAVPESPLIQFVIGRHLNLTNQTERGVSGQLLSGGNASRYDSPVIGPHSMFRGGVEQFLHVTRVDRRLQKLEAGVTTNVNGNRESDTIITHDFHLTSTHPIAVMEKEVAAANYSSKSASLVTTSPGNQTAYYDYIFFGTFDRDSSNSESSLSSSSSSNHNSNTEQSRLTLCGRNEFPSLREMQLANCVLPNAQIPSDHFPAIALFSLTSGGIDELLDEQIDDLLFNTSNDSISYSATMTSPTVNQCRGRRHQNRLKKRGNSMPLHSDNAHSHSNDSHNANNITYNNNHDNYFVKKRQKNKYFFGKKGDTS